jgi:hypothetical protein
MIILEQTPEKLVFRVTRPQARPDSGSLAIAGGLWLLGGLLAGVSLVHGEYAGVGIGACLLMTGGGGTVYEIYRCYASQRVYTLDKQRQEVRIWGWQPSNYGWQPPTYTLRQALLGPTLRRLPMPTVRFTNPVSYHSTSSPFGTLGPLVWQVSMIANDVSIHFGDISLEQVQGTKHLLQSYVTDPP